VIGHTFILPLFKFQFCKITKPITY
jgi:hypothetical protein